MNFKEFVEKSRVSKDLLSNPDAKEVFAFLSSPKTVANLIIFSDMELPALSGTAFKLEKRFDKAKNFPLTNNYNRTITGRMVKYILSHYGYTPAEHQNDKRLRKFCNASLFKTATIYKKNIKPELEINFYSKKVV